MLPRSLTTHIARISALIHSYTTIASAIVTESDFTVTRIAVILNTPDDGFTWLFNRRDVATAIVSRNTSIQTMRVDHVC
jgi:hypothetical protein